jgi:hypothetical protein
MSLAVHNTGSRTILYHNIRFEVKGSRNIPRISTVARSYRQEKATQSNWGFAPGQMALVSGVVEFADPVNYAQMLLNIPGQQSQLASTLSRYSGATFTASIDSIFYADGTVAGPDLAGMAHCLQVESQARFEMIAQLQGLGGQPDANVAAFLAGVLKEPFQHSSDCQVMLRQRMSSQLQLDLQRGRSFFDASVAALVPYPAPAR